MTTVTRGLLALAACLLLQASSALAQTNAETQGMLAGPAEAATRSALARIARLIGFGEAQLATLLRMANAQQQFHQQSATSIEDAYAALGINSGASDAEVKRAFSMRMSENDPDKLIANGVPEEMTRVATEHAREIQTAYDMIKQTRPALR